MSAPGAGPSIPATPRTTGCCPRWWSSRGTSTTCWPPEVSRRTGTPVTCRGGGTSIAGNAIGPGIVIDFARHLNRVLEFDAGSRTALVEPGVVLSSLQARALPHGLRFGPDPSSQNRATLGGMIGNNACGPHAVAYGRTADNVQRADDHRRPWPAHHDSDRARNRFRAWTR